MFHVSHFHSEKTELPPFSSPNTRQRKASEADEELLTQQIRSELMSLDGRHPDGMDSS